MQSLADIKALLAAHGLAPKHRLGQNFLHDPRKYALLMAAADIRPDDQVLEVGPGTGALTEHLLQAQARVLAVEIDADLEPILRQRLAGFGDRFHLIIADILAGKHQIDARVLAAVTAGGRPFKLIANLPYNVASPLLVNLAVDHPLMTRAVVMVQKEVADRLAAGPGGKDYGPLGILVQALCTVQVVGKLPPGCFWPPPQVDSAVVRLVRRDRPLTANPPALAALVHRLFHQRRKQIGTILGRGTPLPPGILPTARPETLTLEQLVQLSETLSAYNHTP